MPIIYFFLKYFHHLPIYCKYFQTNSFNFLFFISGILKYFVYVLFYGAYNLLIFPLHLKIFLLVNLAAIFLNFTYFHTFLIFITNSLFPSFWTIFTYFHTFIIFLQSGDIFLILIIFLKMAIFLIFARNLFFSYF